jgi:hypothetical protein
MVNKMLNKELLINNLEVRQAALKHLIDRDITGNTLEVLAQWREVKWIKEAIVRGEYDLKEE